MGYNKRGNPFKRGKSWTFYYYMPDRRLRYKGGYLTHAEAKEEKERISALVTLGMFVPEERLSVAEFMVNWYETSCYPGLAHNSCSGYTNALYNYVLPYMGTQKLQNITRTTIKGLYKAVCAKSPHVARIVKTIMNTALDAAIEEKLLTKNPARKLQLPITPEKHKKVSFSEQQIVDLLNASKGTCLHLEIILAITLGLRKAELWGLKFSDVDFIAREIHIQRTLGRGDYDSQEYEKRKAEKTLTKAEKLVKTDSGNRNNLLSDLAYMEILRRKAECEKNKEKYGDCYNDGGYICCTKYGDPRSKDYHWKPFKRILENAGLPDIRWHDLRHINASFLFSKHINPKAIANGIGHAKDIITSDIYIATDHVEKEAVEVVADFITNLVPLSASVS